MDIYKDILKAALEAEMTPEQKRVAYAARAIVAERIRTDTDPVEMAKGTIACAASYLSIRVGAEAAFTALATTAEVTKMTAGMTEMMRMIEPGYIEREDAQLREKFLEAQASLVSGVTKDDFVANVKAEVAPEDKKGD